LGRQQILIGGTAFANRFLGTHGGARFLDLDRLEAAGLQLAEGVATGL
jgi:hypothetical protein